MFFETIKQALIKELDLEPEIITEEAMVVKDLNLDSTETVIIALELKKKFVIDFVFPKDDISLKNICLNAHALKAAKETV